MKAVRTIAVVGVAALLVGGVVAPLLMHRDATVSAQPSAATPKPVVQVVPAEVRSMSRTVRVSGTLKSGSEASLSPKAGGKVLAVLVKAGDAVKRGQELVRLDASDQQRQAEQASAGLTAARAAWEKAVQGEKLKRADVERRISEPRRGVDQAKLQAEKAQAGIKLQNKTAQADIDRAQAGVDAAQAALAQAKRGAKPELRQQAEIGVRQAQRGLDLAKKNLDDLEYLQKRGGVPKVQVDQAREDYQKAQDGLAQAKSQLQAVKAGATPDEIAGAEAQVRSAEAALNAAKTGANRGELDKADLAAAQGQLRQAQDGLKSAEASRSEIELAQADVRAAKAAYEQALAGSRLASQQIGASVITSPMDGIASTVTAHAGEMAGPGQPLVTVVGTAGVFLEAAVPSRTLRDIRPGESTSVTVDTVPGRTFQGTVRSIGRVAGPDGRSYPVQIDLSAPAGVLKPGGLARADIQAEMRSNAVTVPLESLRTEGEKTYVWVVRAGRIVAVPVETPIQDDRRAMVEGAIRPGEQVVLSAAAGINPGDAVDTRAAPRS